MNILVGLTAVDVLGHVVGFFGMACVVIAFYMTVEGNWDSKGRDFNVVNLMGGILLLISLCIHFNLGSFIIELFWIAISLKGLYNLNRGHVDLEQVVSPVVTDKQHKTFEEKSRDAGIGA